MPKITEEQIAEIEKNNSLIDYFFQLERQGKVKYDKQRGRDHYFLTENNKYSVNERGYYDFKTGEGGQIIKAVMQFENKNWKEAVDFLKDYSNIQIQSTEDEIIRAKMEKNNTTKNIAITNIVTPNNNRLIEYFEQRGVSREILQQYTKQVHFKVNEKSYFGIGLKNESNGYEIANPYMKTKIGNSDLSIITGNNTKNIVVVEGITDALSFLQLAKDSNKIDNFTVVSLNSVTNTDKFIEKFKNHEGKIHLLLDGDKAGNEATNKILENFPKDIVNDSRGQYAIDELNNKDLNDYLKKKNQMVIQEGMKAIDGAGGGWKIIKNNKKHEGGGELTLKTVPKNEIDLYIEKGKFINYSDEKELFSRFKFFTEEGQELVLKDNKIIIKKNNDEKQTQSTTIPTFESVGGTTFREDIEEHHKTSQSEQNGIRNNATGHRVDSNNVGNGLATPKSHSSRNGRNSEQSVGSSQQRINEEKQRIGDTDGGLRNRRGSDTESESRGTERSEGSEDLSTISQPTERGIGRTVENGNGRGNQGIGENQIVGFGRTSLLNLLKEKPTNENIGKIVNELTFIDEKNKIQIKADSDITEQVKDYISQYKSGGIAKEGRGILDEYYTDEKITLAVRNLIKDNFNGKGSISVLEPSVGTGNFINAIKDLGVKTNITAFEINETTAKISKLLYPTMDVNLRSFESEFITDNGHKKDFSQQYDLVVGNPPYGDHRGFYKGIGEEPKLTKYEDYFVKRSLNVMKENGTLAMVLPSGWLNRQKNLTGAELTNAYRLPNGAFKGTAVGTDIIVLKKNSNAISKDISTYFQENPTKILGTEENKTNRFGKEETVVKGSIEEALAKIEEIEKFNSKEKQEPKEQLNLFDVYDTEIAEKQETTEQSTDENHLKNETIQKVDEALNVLNAIKFKSYAVVNEIEKYINLKYDLKSEKEFSEDNLKDISEKADNIVKTFYKPNLAKEYKVQNTPELKKGVLKYLFEKNDEVVDTRLQNNTNISDKQLEAFKDTEYNGVLNNVEKHKEFANRYNGEWIHDFYYVEGDIYEKLEDLENEFSNDTIDEKQYEKQKTLLESVLPPKKALEDIIISPNHEFIHKFSLGQKEKNIQVPDGVDLYTGRQRYTWEKQMVKHTLKNEFIDFLINLPDEAFGKSNYWEVRAYVDNEVVTGSDKERNALVRERRKEVGNDLFQKFLREELSDDLKEKFVNEFNRKYNNIYIPNYSEFPLFSRIHQNFKGKPLNLTEVQKAGIGRLTTKGVGLLAHEVGFGKTLSGILSTHEAMERGNAKRPLIVVPNDSILKQWVETIFETIPNAKVNVLGNLGKNYDLSNFNNKDGEITLVTYEGFNNIGFRKEVTDELSKRFSYISSSDLSSLNFSERDIQKEQTKVEELQGKMKQGKVYDWEDFGFDHLTFDEVHNANHIVSKVRIDDRKFASDFRNQQQRTSKLGLNTWVASQYIQDQNNGRNVTLLSATPFTNKPLEYYSVLSLMANDRLEKSGYFNVNTFFETFMEADNDMEIDAKGDVKYKMNVRRFKNNDIFQNLLAEFIDIKGEEDNPELKRPNRINKEYKIEQNDLTEEMYAILNNNFDETKEGAILSHILNARLIAFSPYLSKDYNGEVPNTKEFVENSPKLKTTMDLIAQNKADKPEAGQIIYSELAVAEFPKLKEYLINEVGYKENEVEMITGATTKNKRLDIQEKFNEGKIKVIIGSEAIQEGMNLQKNTTDMYLLTLPYNFTSLRQTEGRAWRQGNKWENVRINFMLTNDSIDVFMLQKLQAKQSRYMEAMKNGANVIDVSDVDTQELKTAIITDPVTRAEIEIKLLQKKYEAEKDKHSSELGFISRKFEAYIKSDENKIVNDLRQKYERYSTFAEDGNEYWKKEADLVKERLEKAEVSLKNLSEKLQQQGLNLKDFHAQQQKTQEKIDELDNIIKNELPVIKEQFVAKYEQEKMEMQQKNSEIDFVKERAEENKTFFSEVSESKQENIFTKDVFQRYNDEKYNSDYITSLKNEIAVTEKIFIRAINIILEAEPKFLNKPIEDIMNVRSGQSILNFRNLDLSYNSDAFKAVEVLSDEFPKYAKSINILDEKYGRNKSYNIDSPLSSNSFAKDVLQMIYDKKQHSKTDEKKEINSEYKMVSDFRIYQESTNEYNNEMRDYDLKFNDRKMSLEEIEQIIKERLPITNEKSKITIMYNTPQFKTSMSVKNENDFKLAMTILKGQFSKDISKTEKVAEKEITIQMKSTTRINEPLNEEVKQKSAFRR